MRLLVLTPEYDGAGGGIITFYRALVPRLRRAGLDIHIIEGSAVHAADHCAARDCDGIRVETLERSRLARWWDRFPDFSATPGLRRHLAAAWAIWEQVGNGEGYDIVEASDWGLLFVPPAVEAVRPLIVQCHGSIGQIADYDPIEGEETQSVLVRLIERAVLAAVNLQTYSRANAGFWRTETGRDALMVRPAWERTVASASDRHGGRGLVVGRIQRWKGPQVLCAALKHMESRAPVLDWVGRDTAWGSRESSTVAHLAHAYPGIWGDKIVHRPPVPPEEVMRRQSVALFNLVPSTWDTFNFTAIEAMASGRPTIVSTGAGASELIEDGVNGYLFAHGDADALAGALDRLLAENPARLAEIGRAAQETVRTELDPEAIACRRIAAYGAVIDSFRNQPPSPATGWLGDICRPAHPLKPNQMAFLDHLPLRAIAAHGFKRAYDKVAARITRRAVTR